MRRRHFLKLSTAAVGALIQAGAPALRDQAGGVLACGLDGQRAQATSAGQTVRIPLRFFREDEALTVAAAAARIFPSDESGPGAPEAGVVLYIDRQLAGPYGRDRYRYTKPPFVEGVPEQGYQGQATPREIYRQGLKKLAGFHTLDVAEQDRRLEAMENTTFFILLRQHTIEGLFSDPMHGGNANKIGWQLIGFPGPRMGYYDEVDQYYGQAFRPKPESLSEVLGKPGRPMEEEE